MSRATLIYNPVAGDPQGNLLQKVRHVLEEEGISHLFKPTREAREGTRLAKEAAQEGSDLVIAAGGDGTVNEVVNGLVGTEAILGIIPMGTGNLAAYEFGVPLDPLEAARAIPKSRVERIDVGKANDRYFLMMTSVGLDAKALRDAPRWGYRALHWWAFFWTGFLNLFVTRPFPLRLQTAQREMAYTTRLLVVSNIKGYGLPGCEFLSNADTADGFLDVGFFKSENLWCYLRGLSALGRRRPISPHLVQRGRVEKVRIAADIPVPAQVDGDFYGYTPLEVSVVPKALSILIPQKDVP